VSAANLMRRGREHGQGRPGRAKGMPRRCSLRRQVPRSRSLSRASGLVGTARAIGRRSVQADGCLRKSAREQTGSLRLSRCGAWPNATEQKGSLSLRLSRGGPSLRPAVAHGSPLAVWLARRGGILDAGEQGTGGGGRGRKRFGAGERAL
jgi:hypothetical protein